MNQKEYLDMIFNNLKCSKKNKKKLYNDIQKKMDDRIAQGMTFEEVKREMGSPEEIRKEIEYHLLENGQTSMRRLCYLYRLCIFVESISGIILLALIVRALYYHTIINDFVQNHFDGSEESFMVAWPDYTKSIFILFIMTIILFLVADFNRRRIKKRTKIK